MKSELKVCPKHNIYCSLWIDGRCHAHDAYGVLLNHYWKYSHTLPVGSDALPLVRDIERVLCKNIRKYMSVPEELQHI